MADNVLIASDITVELGSDYVGSAYSPRASVTQTDTGWELTITYADPDTPGELATLTIPVDSAGFGEVTASVESGHGTPQVTVTESGPDTAKSFHFAFSGIVGFSPTITVTEIEHGHRVTVTDVDGTESFDELDGDPSQAIEDAERAAALANAAAATADASAAAADTATEAAQAATTAAQTATSATQTATSAANTATGRANTAATGATSAASAAQTATTAAQAATTAADTAADNAQDAADRANAATAGITDAYSPMFTAGASDGITGGGPSDTAAWVERTCPGTDGPAKVESIHGRTVVWNQQVRGYNASYWTKTTAATISSDDATQTLTLTSNSDSSSAKYARDTSATLLSGHTYLVRANIDARNCTSAPSLQIIGGSNGMVAASMTAGTSGVASAVGATSQDGYPCVRFAATTPSGEYAVFSNMQIFDLTAMFGAGNEPSTVEEFEALFPDAYYPYDAGSLLSVNMTGIETVGFNLWDEQWEVGGYSVSNGTTWGTTDRIRSKADNYIPVLPDTEYCITRASGVNVTLCYYDADKTFISGVNISASAQTFTTPANARYLRFAMYPGYGTTYNHDICINLSSFRNGEYEPYWQQTRPVPASTYFPGGMRSAGSVYDELTEGAAVTRVGGVDMGTLTWNYANNRLSTDSLMAAIKKPTSASQLPDILPGSYEVVGYGASLADHPNAMTILSSGRIIMYAASADTPAPTGMLHYALATPTTTTIDPPLNLTYKAASGDTERIVHTEQSAPPTLAITYGSTPAGIVASALAAIADPDGPTATATHAVGTYLTMGGKLYRVTSAIAIGETITPGTNVTATTVMAEVLSLVQ